jgi:hypothetical protein
LKHRNERCTEEGRGRGEAIESCLGRNGDESCTEEGGGQGEGRRPPKELNVEGESSTVEDIPIFFYCCDDSSL